MNATTENELKELLHAWLNELDELRFQHILSARWYEKWHWRLGLPSVVLTAVLSAAVWRDYAFPANVGSGWALFTVLMSFATVVLNTSMTFLGPNDRSSQHKVAYSRFDELFRETDLHLARLLTCPPSESALVDLMQRWKKACEDAPTIRHSVIKAAANVSKARLKAREELAGANLATAT